MKTYRAFWSFLVNEGYLKNDITIGIEKLKEKQKVIITLDQSEKSFSCSITFFFVFMRYYFIFLSCFMEDKNGIA